MLSSLNIDCHLKKQWNGYISVTGTLTFILDSNPCAELFSTLYTKLIRGPLFFICFKQNINTYLVIAEKVTLEAK